MADTLVDNDANVSLDDSNGLWGPYWIDTQTAIIVFITGGPSGDDISFRRTTDGGSTWNFTKIEVGTTRNMSCWFDQETPGDSGTLIHAFWLDEADNEAKYINIDISDGSVDTIRTVDSGITVSSVRYFNKSSITKTVSNNIIVAFSTPSEIECYKTDDLFATSGTSIADPFETPSESDYLLLYPANTGDDNDACGIFWDKSVNEISIKMYDDSANTWTETLISGSMVDNLVHFNMDSAVRHSDNHILFAAHTASDTATDDLKMWDLTVDSIASPTITAKTNIFTDQSESSQASFIINQQNDDVYVSYLKGGTWQSEVDVVFHKSDDGMDTWGSEQAYNETTDDNRLVHGGRTIGDSGGRVQWSWFNDDLNDIFVNLVNDIIISGPVTIINPKLKVSGTFATKTAKTKISGSFVEKPVMVKVGGTFK